MLKKVVEVLEHLAYSHTFRSEQAKARVGKLLGELRAEVDKPADEAGADPAEAGPAEASATPEAEASAAPEQAAPDGS